MYSGKVVEVVLFLAYFHAVLTVPQVSSPGSGKEEAYCDNSCRNLNQSHLQVKCKCDRYCPALRDCCVDSPYRGRNVAATAMDCLPLHETGSVHTITACKRRWRGSQAVARKCTRRTNLSEDPIENVPVTNPQTGFTYKNYHCATCNDDSNVIFWKIDFSCQFPPGRVPREKAIENIAYNREKGQWGLWLVNNKNVRTFHGCDLKPEIPTSLQNTVRWCYGQAVSQCADNWGDHLTRIKCDEYLDPVEFGDDTYRNKHCAACNGVDESELFCLGFRTKLVTRRPAHFGALIDFFGDGCVGDSGKCSCGEVWDPFFKRCRKTVSLRLR